MNHLRAWYGVVMTAALFLGGCAGAATAQGMTVTPADIKAPASPNVAKAVGVNVVAGGHATDPLWASQIASKDFRSALVSSLRAAGLLTDGAPPRYLVNAELIALDQPAFGFSMEVTSRIRYTLKDAKTDAVLLTTEVVAPYTATMADSVVGPRRLRLANEGSARKSIAALIAKLNAVGMTASAL